MSKRYILTLILNTLMLKTVIDIRQKELAICTSLLAGFMEQHEIAVNEIRERSLESV